MKRSLSIVVCATAVLLASWSGAVGRAQPPPAAEPGLPTLDDARARGARWVRVLLDALAARAITCEQLVAHFGTAMGPAPNYVDPAWVAVRPRARRFRAVAVGPLAHVRIPTRVEIDLATPLSRQALESEVGALRPLPPTPHGDRARRRYATHRVGSYADARLLAEVERAAPDQVVHLALDATPHAAP